MNVTLFKKLAVIGGLLGALFWSMAWAQQAPPGSYASPPPPVQDLQTAAPGSAVPRLNPDASPADYGLKAGDVLEITVWREADMSRDVLVRPDGAVSFPLVGDMYVAGRSIEEVRAEFNTRLRRFIREPQVSIALKAANGNTFFVLGKVNKPGEFPLRGKVDVMQALSIAGGTAAFASLSDIKILRRDGEGQRAFQFRYEEVEGGRHLDQNILLQGGDVVVVP